MSFPAANDPTPLLFSAPPGERLDKAVVAHLAAHGLSRGQVQTLIGEGRVTVDGTPAKASLRLRGGEQVAVHLPPPAPDADLPQPEAIPLEVLHADAQVIVLVKPAGMVVHPAPGSTSGTLVNALLAYDPALATLDRAGVVHRLDKDTSGLMVVARTPQAQRRLQAQFKARTVGKTYTALLERAPRTRTGRVEAPIGRDPKQRKRMGVLRDGRAAITTFEVVEEGFSGGQVLVQLGLLTGRTHQIRVHMAFIGAPVVGDRVYGFRKQRVRLRRLFLHASALAFDHPASGARLTFDSPLPPTLRHVLNALRDAPGRGTMPATSDNDRDDATTDASPIR